MYSFLRILFYDETHKLFLFFYPLASSDSSLTLPHQRGVDHGDPSCQIISLLQYIVNLSVSINSHTLFYLTNT